MRQLFRLTLLLALAAGSLPAAAQTLIPQSTAARYGLVRAWYAQIGSPRATGLLDHVNYDEGLILTQSGRGLLTAVDAETGRTIWETQIGNRNGSTSEPAANHKFVVVLGGSSLYVVNRANGEIVWQKPLGGAPGAGPGVTPTHAFVPLVSGKIEGYDLEQGIRQTPWNYQSSGRVLTPPMTTELSVSWTTERGYFYVADPAGGGIRYRLETRDAIHSRPAAWSPHVYACSSDGFVYAVDETKGNIVWKFPVGEAIYEPPVAINGYVFVVTEFSGMYSFNSADGTPRWHLPAIKQFVSASPTRVYARDAVGNLAILDINSGAQLGKVPLVGISKLLTNGRSDRIYLVDKGCVVQCLREIALREPVLYRPPPPAKEDIKVKERPKRSTAPAADEEMPAEDAPDEPADDSFSAPEEPGGDLFGDEPKTPEAPAEPEPAAPAEPAPPAEANPFDP
jgi:outer membrane protein assembly factor BamB